MSNQPYIVIAADTPITGKCDSDWKVGLPCPNAAEWIVKCLGNPGFSLMCGPHKEGFQEDDPYAEVEYLPYDATLALQLQEAAVAAGL